ncbi:hypothetical protein MKW98_020392 [Papaver atlanticum]|uniref:Cullin N-terminal domain-containing protein n=1 Tax=Papaver atlanticum TaxID=357466 RepID=A0AAD4X484_9MAGN|nr:hypothetical protein MKW98_020392 [Papaver atlanticum]
MNIEVLKDLEEGWAILQKGITKVINTLEGVPEEPMDGKFLSEMHTTTYNMCTQKPPHDYSAQLYERYVGVFNDYLKSKALPAIQEKDDASMLQELIKRWENHKVMVRKLSGFFNYLDRYFIVRRSLPSLKDSGFGCFRKIDAVIKLVNQERDGEEIDQTLVKNVLEIFLDGLDKKYYVDDFETAFLNDTKDYYTRKVSTQEDLKAEECLQREKDRVSHYLHSSTEKKLLKAVQDVVNPAQVA